jgi:hypothetical protein
MFSCKQHCKIVPQYCNLRFMWAISNRCEQIASQDSQKMCKQSLWLDYKERGKHLSSCSDYLNGFLFANVVQSETLFTNRLWISTCNLFASVANCLEQSAYQNGNIAGQYCIVPCKRTSGLTVIQFNIIVRLQ